MPFESSLPLVVILGAAAVACGWAALAQGSRGFLAAAILAGTAAAGCLLADLAVETDREQIALLLPRLAEAAERGEIETILAAVAPERRPLREEAEQVVRQVQPTEVEITRLEIVIEPGADPPAATADLIVRVTGNVVDRGAQGTAIAAVLVRLEKRGGEWLVVDAEESRIRPGRP